MLPVRLRRWGRDGSLTKEHSDLFERKSGEGGAFSMGSTNPSQFELDSREIKSQNAKPCVLIRLIMAALTRSMYSGSNSRDLLFADYKLQKLRLKTYVPLLFALFLAL